MKSASKENKSNGPALKIWNGRGNCCRKVGDPKWDNLRFSTAVHAYIAAHSRADALRLIGEYCGTTPPDSEIRVYWHEGLWGNVMRDVPPERGLWLEFGRSGNPVRVA